jgi:hypothetical protein
MNDDQYEAYIMEEYQRIANENPNMLLTREDLLEKMNIPQNTPELVVVRSNSKGTGFMRNQYDERYLKRHISQEEFLKTIDYASFIMKKLYSK